MTQVKVYRNNNIINEFTVDSKEEGMKIGREILHTAGLKNTREFFESLVGYDPYGREDIHVSVREIA